MLEENIRLVEQGQDPICTFRNPETNKYIPFMTEQANYANVSSRQGAATMYSPILDAREAAGMLHAK